jgi:formiminoglutamase
VKFEQRPNLLYTRGDRHDPRMGDVAVMPALRKFEKAEWDVTILGFADDRGVILNQGRPGAAQGPDRIREYFYKLVAHVGVRIADLGNLVLSRDLDADHALASEAIALALSRSKRVALLGGGHDWGYSPIATLMQAGRTGFINVDAHLDVRASEVHHSGTSYWRALESGVRGEDALWFGVQPSATSLFHLEYALAKGGCVIESDAAQASQAAAELLSRCEFVDLSLDMDVFSMSAAPGVSAPQPSGLAVGVVLQFLESVLESPRVRTFGIYELCPPHDVEDMTARLAARCLWSGVVQRA